MVIFSSFFGLVSPAKLACRSITYRGPPLQVTSIFEHCALAQRSGASKPCFESRCGLKSLIFMIFDFGSYFGHVHGKPSPCDNSADILYLELALCAIDALKGSSNPCLSLNLWSFFLLLLGSCRRPIWRAGVSLTEVHLCKL